MDHDLKSLQVFMETRFDAIDERSERQHGENQLSIGMLTGKVHKAEIAIAVLKFAVFTIGGALLLAGLQVVVSKLSGV